MRFSAGVLLSCALLLGKGQALPHSKHATLLNGRQVNSSSYDFLVIGGGISGLVLADRLTEDPEEENGVMVPGLWDPSPYLDPYVTEPLTALNNRTDTVVCAKLVGGGSTINAMNWLRGTSADYNAWESLGNSGWGWRNMLLYFKKSENYTIPDAAYAKGSNITWDDSVRGYSGPVKYSYPTFAYPGLGYWWSAAKSVGLNPLQDPEAGVNPGLFWTPTVLDTQNLTRCDARAAHYDRVISRRPNYHVLADHTVSKILFNGTRAVGVEYLPTAGGDPSTILAFKEVLVAAGAIHTPKVLQLSGVGPKALLNSLGIPVISDLPGVGSNFQDHASLTVNYDFPNIITPNANSLATNATFSAEQWALYQAHRPSAFTVVRGLGEVFGGVSLKDVSASNWGSIVSDAAAVDVASTVPADTDSTVLAGYKEQRKILLQQLQISEVAVAVMSWDTYSSVDVSVVKPFSRGTVRISSTDPFVAPLLDYRTATDPTDFAVFTSVIGKLRQIMAAPDMAVLGTAEASPLGATVQTDADIVTVLRQSLGTSSAHQCCSAPMLPLHLGGVVAANHKVYGTTGLRVVDVSTFPMAVSGGPTANVYGSAEKIADIIKEEYGSLINLSI